MDVFIHAIYGNRFISAAAEYLMRYRSLFKSILSLSMLVQSLLNEVLL